MKFLLGETTTRKDDRNNIEVTVRVLNTVTKAQLMDLVSDHTIAGRARYVQALLVKCVDKLVIDGTEFDPMVVATTADVGDGPTLKTLMNIGNLVTEIVFPVEDSSKKSD